MAGLCLGILVDDEHKLHYLKMAVLEAGYRVYCSMLVPNVAGETEAPVIAFDDSIDVESIDAWLVDVTHDDEDNEAQWSKSLQDLLAGDVPVVLSDSGEFAVGTEDHMDWFRRLRQNLQRLQGEINLQFAEVATSVWVLAASTGGPAAIREFLQQLPAELNIAFLYVQHIDEGHESTLLNMVNKESQYPAYAVEQGMVLQANTVTIIDPKYRTEILNNGTFLIHAESWSGPCQPSIDQLVANLARSLSCSHGLIIFTGMGNDGTASCRLIKQKKGQVWVQSPESCVSSSMPESALQTACVDRTGTPKELAEALGLYVQQLKNKHSIERPKAHESYTTN